MYAKARPSSHQTKLSCVIKNANILTDGPRACLISKKLINKRTSLTVTSSRENAKMKRLICERVSSLWGYAVPKRGYSASLVARRPQQHTHGYHNTMHAVIIGLIWPLVDDKVCWQTLSGRWWVYLMITLVPSLLSSLTFLWLSKTWLRDTLWTDSEWTNVSL